MTQGVYSPETSAWTDKWLDIGFIPNCRAKNSSHTAFNSYWRIWPVASTLQRTFLNCNLEKMRLTPPSNIQFRIKKWNEDSCKATSGFLASGISGLSFLVSLNPWWIYWDDLDGCYIAGPLPFPLKGFIFYSVLTCSLWRTVEFTAWWWAVPFQLSS